MLQRSLVVATAALLSVVSIPSPAHAIPTATLQLWLTADAGVVTTDSSYTSGSIVTDWLDQSGHGNHATSESSGVRPTLVSNGVNDKLVLNFDGVNDRLRIADAAGLDGGTGQTVFIYTRPTSDAGAPEMLAKWDYPSQGSYAYELTGGPRIFGFVTVVGDGGSNYRISSNTISMTSFNAVTVVYDGTQLTDTTRLQFFNNNVSLGDLAGGGTIPSVMQDSASPVTIGAFPGLGRFFQGQMAEILIYNSVLSPAERTEVYNYLNVHWTPEPTSLTLLAMGGLIIARRRRQA